MGKQGSGNLGTLSPTVLSIVSWPCLPLVFQIVSLFLSPALSNIVSQFVSHLSPTFPLLFSHLSPTCHFVSMLNAENQNGPNMDIHGRY